MFRAVGAWVLSCVARGSRARTNHARASGRAGARSRSRARRQAPRASTTGAPFVPRRRAASAGTLRRGRRRRARARPRGARAPARAAPGRAGRNQSPVLLQPRVEAAPHLIDGLPRLAQRVAARARDLDQPPRLAAALGDRIAHPAPDEALVFEASQRDVDGHARGRPPGPPLDFVDDRDAVRVFLARCGEVQDGKQDELLELAERVTRHVVLPATLTKSERFPYYVSVVSIIPEGATATGARAPCRRRTRRRSAG